MSPKSSNTRSWLHGEAIVCAVRSSAALLVAVVAAGCTTVGPDYEEPAVPLAPSWYSEQLRSLEAASAASGPWWRRLQSPDLNQLIELAHRRNNNLEIAGLRVLESRAQLGIAVGAQFPQTQVIGGSATTNSVSENDPNTAAGDLRFTQYELGLTAAWELDFWGRFRRGVEAADAAYLSSLAAYDDVMILVTGQVATAYIAICTLQEQLSVTRENIAAQQRSYEIVDVQFRNGDTSELDVLQARTLLLGTQATVPQLQAGLRQAKNALSTLLGMTPGSVDELLTGDLKIPKVPELTGVGVPADVLRRRPDVRRAEYLAMAQNANVGLAEADLYPSFTISGSIGLAAGGNTDTTRSGKDGFGELFSSDSVTYSAGGSFVWPFFNYGRIRNNVRVQDARLQQALTSYRESVIQAARDVEDAAASLGGAKEQNALLSESVQVAKRATDVSLLRFREGFANYQRVLDSQQAQFVQQSGLAVAQGDIANAFIALNVALAETWQAQPGSVPLIPEVTRKTMSERTNWGNLIDASEVERMPEGSTE